jgi:hypothetical protein
MAKAVINSLRKKKQPKRPKMNASKSAWDNYEKKKKAVDAHNKAVETEKSRRQKIAAR